MFDPTVDDATAEHALLAAARDGSAGAFGVLYARYRESALVTARAALPAAEASHAEDVVEVAFVRVLGALRNGKGPTDTLRYYLTTTVRREVWRSRRRRRRQAEAGERWTREERARRGDEAVIDLDAEAALGAASAADLGGHELLGEAFRGLSDRWRHVLWLTEVEGRRPAELAGLLGLTPGSAAALAYRARQGLVAAYADAYGTIAGDPACQALAGRLGRYLAAGTPSTGFDDVVGHLEGCERCRDAARGIDVAGTTWRGLAPFGLLTSALWAQGLVAGGGVKLAGAAVGAGAAVTGGVAAGGSAGTATTAAGGVGTGGLVAGAAAAVAVVALAAGALAAVRSGGSPPPAESAGAVAGAEVDAGGGQGGGGRGADRPTATTGPTTSAAPTVPDAPPPGLVDEPRPVPEAPPAVPVPAPRPAPQPPTTSAPRGTTTTSSSTVPTSSTTSSTTTSTTEVPDGAQVGGRVQVDGGPPVAGVTITVLAGIIPVAEAVTGPDGRWEIDDLPPGTYWLLATIPSTYAPTSGDDPWTGGPTWLALLGFHDLAGGTLTSVDLPLALR